MIKHKTSTYMGFPNHCFLWAQWTSETMNLGMRKEGDGGMDGGRERNTNNQNQTKRSNKMGKTGQDMDTKTPRHAKACFFLCVVLAFLLIYIKLSCLSLGINIERSENKTNKIKLIKSPHRTKKVYNLRNPTVCKTVTAVSC